METNGGDELIQCPYNHTHMILAKRFQVHLVRCRRSYPLAEKASCPFNITHQVNKAELNWHVTVCPDRRNFERFRHVSDPIVGLSSSVDESFGDSRNNGNSQKVTVEGSENWVPDESWDSVEPMKYNPTNYTASANILRKPVGMKPSERSAFRESERKRLQNLKK